MSNTVDAINCLLSKEVITQEQANAMIEIATALPDDVSSLLKILIALTITQEAP